MFSFHASASLGDERWEYNYTIDNAGHHQRRRPLPAIAAPLKRSRVRWFDQRPNYGSRKSSDDYEIALSTSRTTPGTPASVDSHFDALSIETQELQRAMRERARERAESVRVADVYPHASRERSRERVADAESLKALERATASLEARKVQRRAASKRLDPAPAARADDGDESEVSSKWSVISSPPTSDLCKFLDLRRSPASSPLLVREVPTPPTFSSDRHPASRRLFHSYQQAHNAVAMPPSRLSRSHDYAEDPFGSLLVEDGEARESRLKESTSRYRAEQVDAVSRLFDEVRMRDEEDLASQLRDAMCADDEAEVDGPVDESPTGSQSAVRHALQHREALVAKAEETHGREEAKEDEDDGGVGEDSDWVVV